MPGACWRRRRCGPSPTGLARCCSAPPSTSEVSPAPRPVSYWPPCSRGRCWRRSGSPAGATPWAVAAATRPVRRWPRPGSCLPSLSGVAAGHVALGWAAVDRGGRVRALHVAGAGHAGHRAGGPRARTRLLASTTRSPRRPVRWVRCAAGNPHSGRDLWAARRAISGGSCCSYPPRSPAWPSAGRVARRRTPSPRGDDVETGAGPRAVAAGGGAAGRVVRDGLLRRGLRGEAFIAYWFADRFDTSTGARRRVLAVGVLQTLSFLAAGRLADRFGLLTTMVFTHLPSNVLLVAVAFAPNLAGRRRPAAGPGGLVADGRPDPPGLRDGAGRHRRSAPRPRRTTNTARYVTRPIGPLLAGAAQSIAIGAPFVIAGRSRAPTT